MNKCILDFGSKSDIMVLHIKEFNNKHAPSCVCVYTYLCFKEYLDTSISVF